MLGKIPKDLLINVFIVALSGSNIKDKEWRKNVSFMRIIEKFAKPLKFSKEFVLISLGSNWAFSNYYNSLKEIKEKYSIFYIPLIYDFIPLLFPQYCIDSVVRDFKRWIEILPNYANAYLTISNSTKNDLIAYFHTKNIKISSNKIKVISLNAYRKIDLKILSTKNILDIDKFILFVSTIEPRKY